MMEPLWYGLMWGAGLIAGALLATVVFSGALLAASALWAWIRNG
jgi:hypothetical protein